MFNVKKCQWLSGLYGHLDTNNRRWYPFCKPENNNDYDENDVAVLC